MEKQSNYQTIDGRRYAVTMTWSEKFKDSDEIFKVYFKAIDRETDRSLTLPREFATYQIGDPEESMGERVKHYYAGNRELLMADYLTTAYRRVCDFIERGK